MSNVLIIIAQKNFQPIEYKDTRAEIEKAGFSVKVASLTTDDAIAKDGSIVKPDISVDEVKVEEYSAVVVIGGPGALALGEYYEVLHLLQDAEKKGKIVAAICIAPIVLAKAGVLDGKKATVWNGDGEQFKLIEERGAIYVDSPVVVDGKIITADGPHASRGFGKAITVTLIEYHL